MINIIYCILIILISHPVAFAEYLSLPKDANGWTVFTPSSDTRILYVSASGNDTLAAASGVYTIANHPDWTRPFNPTGSIQPFATYNAAYAQTRDGYPDWILFKRGDILTETIGGKVRNGRDGNEPFLIGSYGNSGNSPTIQSGQGTYNPAINRCCSTLEWIAISGIDFYNPYHDPGNQLFESSENDSDGFRFYVGNGAVGMGILVEGSKFRYFANNTLQAASTGSLEGVMIRRNIINNNWNDDAHSQGIYAYNVSLTIEDNILDNNGWLSSAGSNTYGEATIYNHNIYVGGLSDSSIKNNILSRGSSIGTKIVADGGQGSTHNLVINNNLYLDNEIAASVGGNTQEEYRFKDVNISDNVVTALGKSNQTNRGVGWGFEIIDWDGGYLNGNLIIHNNATNSKVMLFQGTSKNVTVNGNIVFDFDNLSTLIDLDSSLGINFSLMTLANNIFNLDGYEGYNIISDYDPIYKWTFSSNKYYSSQADGSRFKLLGSDVTDLQWNNATGDNSTFEQATFPSPTRSIETYMQSLGETATVDAFIAAARAQDRYNWNTAYTAPVVNQWIKAGFGLGGTKYKNVKSIIQETP